LSERVFPSRGATEYGGGSVTEDFELAGVAEVSTPERRGVEKSVPLPKRGGPKTMLPSSWLGRKIRVEYVSAWGEGVGLSATYLDWAPSGIIVNVKGSRTLLAWDCVKLVELVEDQ
jgi:hypothetical protein